MRCSPRIVSVERIEAAQVIGREDIRADYQSIRADTPEQTLQIVNDGLVLLRELRDRLVQRIDSLAHLARLRRGEYRSRGEILHFAHLRLISDLRDTAHREHIPGLELITDGYIRA